jgi:UDP:flavonoid glycosyltransferase YjiC (YdhE family)
MRQTICYYITGFGFGHLMRSLAIMEEMLRKRDDIHIIVKADQRLLVKAEQHLAEFQGRVSFSSFTSYFSIFIDPVALRVDISTTKADAIRWINDLPRSAEAEARFLREQRVQLVLSDIVPEAFEAAHRVGIPAVGISNFTWYEICADVCGTDEGLQGLMAMYKRARGILLYPYSTEDLIPIDHKIHVGPVVRTFDWERVRAIRAQYKREDRPLIFLSVGGSTRVDTVPFRTDVDYIVTMGVEAPNLPNIHRLPEHVADSHNYLAAADLVITKCGWSTVAEATLAQKPLWLMLSKNGWLEERCIHAEVANLGIGKAIDLCAMEQMTGAEVTAEIRQMTTAYSQLPEKCHSGLADIVRILEFYL